MTDNSTELKDVSLQCDHEYRELVAKHHELESRLSELSSKHYLSEPEQVEAVTLKKRKLQLKDRMADIMRRQLNTSPGSLGPSPSPQAR